LPFHLKSFRDPDAKLFESESEIIRVVDSEYGKFLCDFMTSTSFQKFEDKIVETSIFADVEKQEFLNSPIDNFEDKIYFRHKKIIFPSYPYEWPAEMLHAAGNLTIELAKGTMGDEVGLKDATPFNILFEGPKPIFIDLASFEYRHSCDQIWLPEGQFLRNFIYPLVVSKLYHMPIKDIFSTHRDGLTPDHVYRMLSVSKKLNPFILGAISLSVWAEKIARRKSNLHKIERAKNPQLAAFILERLYARLRKKMAHLKPEDMSESFWSEYMANHLSYSAEDFEKKEAIVKAVIEEIKPNMVLDIGCNVGNFSCLAAHSGASVVAIDTDEKSVGRLWNLANRDCLNILPLVVDLVNPTPALGWRNKENTSFLSRADGKFDFTIMLAVVHHMMIDGGIEIGEILSLVRSLTTKSLLIEYIDPSDEMFQKLLKGRERLYAKYNKAVFLTELKKVFPNIRELSSLKDGRRVIYLAQV
jgi:2-polyprenyl-3-methyl-5-hydroxy-6-metoxy-1,4-benzoquinol methylase